MKASVIHSIISGRDVRRPLQFGADDVRDYADLRLMGIDIGDAHLVRQMAAALDAAPAVQPTMYSPTVPTPVQFLQNWLPGFVRVVTQAQTIDDILGVVTAGDWEDEEIVQGVLEPTGLAQPYGDYTNIPLASWNLGYERRTIVRFEEGLRVGKLEEARAGKARVNSAATKRAAAAMALDILRNRIGFYGFNNGENRTYGLLNDPNLPAYVNVAGGTWSTKTFLQITADIRTAVGALIVKAGGHVRAGPNATNATPLTLVLPLGADNYLGVTSDYGNSVAQWLKETYPNMRIITAPEFAGANGGANVFYLFADRIDDGDSDDGGQTFAQIVPTRFRTIGVEQQAKAYVEDYSNATAGVMLKRPFLVVRYSGI
jgi:hypothetical protein